MSQLVNGRFTGELQPDEIVGGCINIYENAWRNWKDTIDIVENECQNTPTIDWQHATTVGHGARQDIRTNFALGISHLADLSNNIPLQNIHNQFNSLLLATTIPYAKRYKIQEPLWHEPYNLLKYSGGQEYKQHYDSGTEMARIISAVVYLNDDYVGGEIEFPHFNLKIKPQAGMLILFPSNFTYAHIAHPVTSGSKYNLVTWIRDREAPII